VGLLVRALFLPAMFDIAHRPVVLRMDDLQAAFRAAAAQAVKKWRLGRLLPIRTGGESCLKAAPGPVGCELPMGLGGSGGGAGPEPGWGEKSLRILVDARLFNRSLPLHRPIIFGNVRADLCETRALSA
jgi:hypothetical protein